MKFYKSLAAILAAAIMVSGCATKGGTGYPEEDNHAIDRIVSEEIEEDEDDTGDDTSKIDESDITETEETDSVSEYYSFTPYVYSEKLSEIRDDKFWQAFYNMLDAIRAGEDSFECPDEETYWQVIDPYTLNNLYPVACVNISPYYGDGLFYENGRGYIYYAIPKEEFDKKRLKFEEEITAILHECVKTDYSDFEKCLSLYTYIADNFTYDYEKYETGRIDLDEGGVYSAFSKKCGICNEIASIYAYLLLQCGVDALTTDSSEDGHSWTYVILDGQGYHCDPTWALRDEGEDLFLWDFLTTSEYRAEEGLHPYQIGAFLFYDYDYSYNETDFSADDEKYSELWPCAFDSLDTENNIVYCHEFPDGTPFEYRYED